MNQSPSPSPTKTHITWTAPARPYKKRTREYYTTIASLVLLLGIILFLIKEFLLIGVILSMTFLAYVFASIPPEQVTHHLTDDGIKTDGKLFAWSDLTQFWLDQKWHQDIIYIQTKNLLPNQLILLLDPQKKPLILQALRQHLPENKPQESFTDRASRWLQEKFPLE